MNNPDLTSLNILIMNSINIIHPYKYHNQWVFDDENKNLDKEAFVAGADDLITKLLDGQIECVIIFSEIQFPGAKHNIEFVKPYNNGSVYYHKELDHQLWLCPALLKYFDKPPAQIYFSIKPA